MITKKEMILVLSMAAISVGLLLSAGIEMNVDGGDSGNDEPDSTFTSAITMFQKNTFKTNTWDPSNQYKICVKNLKYSATGDGKDINKFKLEITNGDTSGIIGQDKSLSGTGTVGGISASWNTEYDESGKSWKLYVTIKEADGANLDGGEVSIKVSMYGRLNATATALAPKAQESTITVPIKSSDDASKYKINIDSYDYNTKKIRAYAVDSMDSQKTRSEFQDPTGPGDVTEAEAGQVLCICVYPSDGNRVKSVKLTGSGGDVSTTVKNEKLDSGAESVTGTQKVYFATMPAYDVKVVVDFDYHKLTVNATNGQVERKLTGVTTEKGIIPVGGSGTPNYSIASLEAVRDGTNYFAGDYVQLTPKANSGYEFKSWSIDGATITGNELIIGSSDVTVTAIFEPIQYTIASGSISNGKLNIGASTAAVGTSVSVTATPDRGYVLESITVTTVGGTAVKFENGSFTMPASDVTVNAVFKDDGKVPTMSCTPSTQGANTILDVNIDCSKKIDSISDPRILVVAKYGDNVINVYSKPVLTGGVGTDRIVVSTLGLTSVVLELVDGIQPGADGTVGYYCYCTYTVAGTS